MYITYIADCILEKKDPKLPLKIQYRIFFDPYPPHIETYRKLAYTSPPKKFRRLLWTAPIYNLNETTPGLKGLPYERNTFGFLCGYFILTLIQIINCFY